MVIKYLKALVFDWRKKRAIEKAQKSANLYRKKFIVIVFNDKPVVVSMQGLKKMIRTHRFSKGLTTEKINKIAIYTAMPQPLKK